MSVDRSLKVKGSLSRHRNVLTRTERIQRLLEQERFKEGDRPWGLPKVAHRKAVGGKAKKAAKKEGEGAEAGAAAAPGAAGAPPAAVAATDKKAGADKKAAPDKKGGADKKAGAGKKK